MKLGFYIHITDKSDQTIEIFHKLNDSVEGRFFQDASLFYNNVAFCPVIPKFGMFNATDIWHYTGVLISTTLDNTNFARQAINSFKLFHLFDPKERNLFQLLSISNDVDVVTRNKEDSKEFFRLTSKNPVYQLTDFNIQEMLEEICQQV